MEKRDKNLLKEKTKRLSIIESGFYGVHEGVGIKYIAPFALAIGKNNPYVTTFIAILHSLPYLVGNLSELFTNKIINKYKRKNILAFFVILQSITWFGILASGLLFFNGLNSNFSLILLVIFYVLLVSFGSFVSPVWASLMRDIVDYKRGSYFSKRNITSGFISLVCSLIAGIFLDKAGFNNVFISFSILFLFAFVFRFLSGISFIYHYEPKFNLDRSKYFSFTDFIKKYRKSNFVKFTLFISLFMLAVSLSGPFFVVYMINDLGFNYLTWTVIGVAGSLSTLFFMPFWGNFIDNYGSLKTLKVTGILASIVPLLWMFSYYMNPAGINIVIFLIMLEIFAGCMWAGFNLSYSNFIYDVVTLEKMHLCSAYFNIIYAVGIFVGSAIGSVILSLKIKLFFVSSIFLVFFISGIFRLLVYLIMIPKINEVRDVKNISVEKAFRKLFKYNLRPFMNLFNFEIIKSSSN